MSVFFITGNVEDQFVWISLSNQLIHGFVYFDPHNKYLAVSFCLE